MDFVLCILIMHLFVFISPWHDKHPYLDIGKMSAMNYGNFIMLSYSLSFDQLHDHCCHTQSTFSLKSCGDCRKRVTHFLGGINTSLIL